MERTNEFIAKAKNKHNGKYIYDLVFYDNAKTKVEIKCPLHGIFNQTPNNHLRGQGCPKCAKERKLNRIRNMALTSQEFIDRAVKLYQKNDYSETVYVASHKPVTIRCLLHGEFKVARAEKHLKGQGCPSCSTRSSAGEQLITNWLDRNCIPYTYQKKFPECRSPTTNRQLSFDFFIPANKLLVEYDGEQHTKKSPLFHTGDKFERMQRHDIVKTTFAAENGYTLIRISFHEFNQIEEILNKSVL